MDVYEATQALLSEIVPDANVTSFDLKYDIIEDQFQLPSLPAVTYIYENLTPIVNQDGATNLYRALIDIEAWGNLETVSKNGMEIMNCMSGQRLAVENVVFTVTAIEVRDVYEVGFDFYRRIIRFSGLIDIGEDKDESR